MSVLRQAGCLQANSLLTRIIAMIELRMNDLMCVAKFTVDHKQRSDVCANITSILNRALSAPHVDPIVQCLLIVCDCSATQDADASILNLQTLQLRLEVRATDNQNTCVRDLHNCIANTFGHASFSNVVKSLKVSYLYTLVSTPDPRHKPRQLELRIVKMVSAKQPRIVSSIFRIISEAVANSV